MRKIIAVGLIALALGLTGCSQGERVERETPVSDSTGYEINPNDLTTMTIEMPSGRTVECVILTYKGSGLQCWEVSR